MVATIRRSYACGCASAANQTKTAYIALGSNMGDRVAEIEKACRLMDERGIAVKRTSSLYETEPMYVTDQDRFLNGACEVGPYPFSSGMGLMMLTVASGRNELGSSGAFGSTSGYRKGHEARQGH